MSWGMIAVAGASLVGGAMSSSASKSAAKSQSDAANAATAQQQQMFDTQVGLEAPFRTAGVDSLNKLSYLFGISPRGYSASDTIGTGVAAPGSVGANGMPAGAASAGMAVPDTYVSGQTDDPLWESILKGYNDASTAKFGAPMNRSWGADGDAQAQYQALKQQYIAAKTQQQASEQTQAGVATPQAPVNAQGQTTASADGYGSLAHNFDLSDFQLDPGIQFQMQQGNQALMNSQAAKNGVLSGASLKDLIAYNQGMAGTGYQSAYERYMGNKAFTLNSLMGVTNLGQAAATNAAAGGAQYAGGMANTITGAGNAAAAGTVGSANAVSGGLSGAANSFFLSGLLNKGGADTGAGVSPPNPFYTGAG